MRYKWFGERWQGVVLAAIVATVTVWLALHDQLKLYIHPRYIWFTTAMAVIALGCLVLERVRTAERTRLVSPWTLGAGLICVCMAGALLLLPARHLSSETATQRGVNSGSIDFATTATTAAGADYTQFSVKEWASLLAQTTDPAFYSGKQARVTGFVSPEKDDGVFYLSRFVVTCCAVDARPIGVPVAMPNWQKTYAPDQWLMITGSFVPSGDGRSMVLQPTSIKKIDPPKDPYVY